MGVKCFMVTHTDRYRLSLRRFVFSSDASKCPGNGGYHNASGPEIAVVTASKDPDGHYNLTRLERENSVPHDDPRWPRKCDGCDYQFTETDEWQVFADAIWLDDAGKEYSMRRRVPGMMWFADWMGDYAKGPDGHCLMVVCPGGGEWCIDGPASNCTMKNDTGPFGKAHRCWVRHGTPPNITVDKNGKTCAAGAGSIIAGKYHGFLRNGEFT